MTEGDSRFLHRVREALEARGLHVEREIAEGGMGVVLLGRDVNLDKPVAIKVVRPEIATAHAVERFTREGRLLAKLNHPNVVPIHQAGESDGIYYHVMDFIEGPTLAEQIAEGPLPIPEAIAVAQDALRAVEAMHELGIVHRDIKPSNIFRFGGRALLGDFGIAKRIATGDGEVTATGQIVGTPSYMSPEQLTGADVTAQSDLYAVAVVLYEMLTGRKWLATESMTEATWHGIPLRLCAVLQRALAWSPDHRYADARELSDALTSATRRMSLTPLAVAAVVGLAVVGLFVMSDPLCSVFGRCAALPRYDIAIEPLTVIPDEGDRENLTTLVANQLQAVSGLNVSPHWQEALRNATDLSTEGVLERFRANRVARAQVVKAQAGATIDVDMLDGRSGRPLPGALRRVQIPTWDLQSVGDSISLTLIRHLRPDLDSIPHLTTNVAALLQFLRAERAFLENNWPAAQRGAAAAVELDPSFTLAWWRLASAWRWGFAGDPFPAERYQWIWEHREGLSTVDQRLLAADLLPFGTTQIDALRAVHADYPDHAFAALSYGDELFDRGPLVGIPIEETIRVLRLAAAADTGFSPTFTLLTITETHVGARDSARRHLNRLLAIAAPPEVVAPYPHIASFLEQAYLERFDPEAARERRMEMLDASALQFAVRWGNRFDLPYTELELGTALAELPLPAPVRGSGRIGQALAFVALGRLDEAVTAFAQAAELLGTQHAILHAAEIPVALRLLQPNVTLEPVRDTRSRLEALEPADTTGRAAWSLALLATLEGDGDAVATWRARALDGRDPANAYQLPLLDALIAGARGETARAIEISDALLPYNPLTRGGNPFARSLLHMKRAEWLGAAGMLAAADSALVWYQGQDLVGLPGGSSAGATGVAGDVEVQQGEVDWAMGAWARVRRAQIAAAEARFAAACDMVQRVTEFWTEATPALLRELNEVLDALPEPCQP